MIENIVIIAILSMLPISELRGAIPYGIINGGLDPLLVFIIAIIFNFIPAPPLIILMRKIEIIARKYNFTRKLIDKYFSRIRASATPRVKIYKEIALIMFVAIPLPFTGVWTASIVAYLFGLDLKKSLLCIFIGLLIAGIIVLSITVLIIDRKTFLYFNMID